MEKKNACDVLSTKLEEMQASNKIDTTVISVIGAIVDECKSREKSWVSNTEIPPQVAFVLYHASRNTRMIFGKMHNRFIHASELHENPKVVGETAIVFPELLEMCNLLDSLKTSEITQEMVGFLRRRVRNLRNTAQKVSMFPTIQEETESINKDDLAKEFAELASHLKANLI